MLLDPWLKKVAFADVGAADQNVRRLKGEMTASENMDTEEELNTWIESTESGMDARAGSDGLWHAFDGQVAEMTSKRTPASDAMVEFHQYVQLKNIGRKEDPLLWWHQNHSQYPHLKHLALKYLCIPGTSVQQKGCFQKLVNLCRQEVIGSSLSM